MKKTELVDMYSFYTMSLDKSIAKKILPATGRGGVSAARDYTQAICLLVMYNKENPQYNGDFSHIKSTDDLWNGLHPATRFRLRAYTPCLAARYDELNEKEQAKLFEDPNITATEKINGCRTWVIFTNDDQLHIFSRNYSDQDCSLLEYSSNVDQHLTRGDYQGVYAVDCEIVFEPGCDIRGDLEQLGLQTDSQLEAMVALLHTHPEDAIRIQQKFKDLYHRDIITFRLIAPLYVDGKNYLKRTLGDGQDIYDRAIEAGQKMGLNIKPIRRCNGNRAEKEVFLNTILNDGGEGVVFHNRNGIYCTSENRSRTSFIKLKRTVSATENGVGLGDTIDAYVTGFTLGTTGTANEGIIGGFQFSIHVDDEGRQYEHMIAVVPNITREERLLATWNNSEGLYPTTWKDKDGIEHPISLNPEFDGLVAELSGQALSAKSQRLEHPRMIMWRPERMPDSCIYTKAWLTAQTTASVHNGGGISYSAK